MVMATARWVLLDTSRVCPALPKVLILHAEVKATTSGPTNRLGLLTVAVSRLIRPALQDTSRTWLHPSSSYSTASFIPQFVSGVHS